MQSTVTAGAHQTSAPASSAGPGGPSGSPDGASARAAHQPADAPSRTAGSASSSNRSARPDTRAPRASCSAKAAERRRTASRAAATAVATTTVSRPASAKPCTCSVRSRCAAKSASSGVSHSTVPKFDSRKPEKGQESGTFGDPQTCASPTLSIAEACRPSVATPAAVPAGPSRSMPSVRSQVTENRAAWPASASRPAAPASASALSCLPSGVTAANGASSSGRCRQSRLPDAPGRNTPTSSTSVRKDSPARWNSCPTVSPAASRVASETAISTAPSGARPTGARPCA